MSPRTARRLLSELALLPVVALASYLLVAALPPPALEHARTLAEQRASVARYREDLGLGSPWGFFRPWRTLLRGERLGAFGQGVDAQTLAHKLAGSLAVGSLALALALPLALLVALARGALARSPARAAPDALAALVFATPVFVPAMLLAPRVIATHPLLETSVAAALLALWPGFYLGTLLADAVRVELASDYARTAASKGLSPARVVTRHALPNVWPALLDAARPVATAVLAGSFALERVFGLHHFGELYVRAVIDKQPSVVVVCTTLFAAVLVVVGLAVELLRLALDPRASREEG